MANLPHLDGKIQTLTSGGTRKTALVGGNDYVDEGARNRGVYARIPGTTPKYFPSEGRGYNDGYSSNMRVARMYLTGSPKPIVGRSGDVTATLGGGLSSTNEFGLSFGAESANATLFQHGYVGFLLSQVQEVHREKLQVIPLNGDNYAAYFPGAEPSVYSFSGYLMNTRQDEWRVLMHLLYQKVLRGSRVASHRHLVQIAYDSFVVTGVLINLTQIMNSNLETAVEFKFDMLVKHVYTDTPAADLIGGAFLGDTSQFAKAAITVPDKDFVGNLVKTGAVAPPGKTRKRKSGNAAKRCACGKINMTRAMSGAATRSFQFNSAACDCTPKQLLAARAALAKKIAKPKLNANKKQALEAQRDHLGSIYNAKVKIKTDEENALLIEEAEYDYKMTALQQAEKMLVDAGSPSPAGEGEPPVDDEGSGEDDFYFGP